MKRITKFAALAAIALLGACGKMGELEPKAGVNKVPVAYGAEKPDGADDLINPSPQARPERSVELIRRSYARGNDPFDLPPGSEPKTGDNIANDDTQAPNK